MQPTSLRTLRIFAAPGLVIGMSIALMPGCDPLPEGGVPGCDLSCPVAGLAEGNAAITGVAEVDAFFGAVVDLSAEANRIAASLDAELDAIGLSLGLPAGSDVATVRGALETKLSGATTGGLKFAIQPPRCEASVDVAIAAAAECDASVQPATASASCEGACEVEGGATATCEGDATLTCTGPKVACDGSCEGTCELTAPGTCEGTCRGTCSSGCTVTDAQGNCAGECTGDCTGSCELAAGGSCSGNCEGQCTLTDQPTCEATASARCEAGASGSVDCEGRCEGEVEPPAVKGECTATVEAKADASIECFPPSIELTWAWSPDYELDAAAQTEFKTWVRGLQVHVANMAASGAKADILIEALEDLGDAGVTAIQSSGDTLAAGDPVASFKLLTCGAKELTFVPDLLGGATTRLTGSLSGSVEVFTAVGISP